VVSQLRFFLLFDILDRNVLLEDPSSPEPPLIFVLSQVVLLHRVSEILLEVVYIPSMSVHPQLPELLSFHHLAKVYLLR